jgi:GINS complex subunit 2
MPGIPTRVPLWLALALRQMGKCRVIPPAWLDAESLGRAIAAERADRAIFQPVPFH